MRAESKPCMELVGWQVESCNSHGSGTWWDDPVDRALAEKWAREGRDNPNSGTPTTGRIRPRYHTYGPPVDVREEDDDA